METKKNTPAVVEANDARKAYVGPTLEKRDQLVEVIADSGAISGGGGTPYPYP